MKNLLNLILLFSCLCTAQIDPKNVTFRYITKGRIGDCIDVEFEVCRDSSVSVYKYIERREFSVSDNKPRTKVMSAFEISRTVYASLISELENAFRLKPEEEEYDCFHSNLLIVHFSRNGKKEELSMSCIEPDANSTGLKLLRKLLKIINEKS
ncbi:hypothetical protein NAT51_05130 [Flavobacterium amniphilum]|uniref:hypothetical protein n=1 Tax=Flavobacterium amniphilum TaxID=1834035 RepID=UPI00202A2C50|nr:hypothetical protein [Flavobacterium amniphilum]MCL9804891.1 hypothetical protein [Flavobacterium amniphilum]